MSEISDISSDDSSLALSTNSSLSSSSSDDDLEIVEYIARRTKRFKPRNLLDSALLRSFEFRNKFRLSEDTALYITMKIERAVSTASSTRNTPLSPYEKLLVSLRYYATNSIQEVIGDLAGVNKSTVCRCIHTVSHALACLASEYINMPVTEQEKQSIQMDFYNIGKFPRAIGAIDCTHVEIQSPGGENAELWRNRKGKFTMNVQTVADSHLLIRDIVCRWPGSSHDSTIFDNSSLKQRFMAGEFGKRYLLGDSGYPQLSYLMTPYRNVTTQEEEFYNKSQIRTRNTVERSYGLWKRRFPCLGSKLRVKKDHVEAIIVACAVLHNICRRRNEPDFEGPDNGDVDDDDALDRHYSSADGFEERQTLTQSFFRVDPDA